MAMFTLRDAMTLAQNANRSDIDNTIYNSAINGNYILTPEQAANEVDRAKTGAHLKDAGGGLSGTLASGKLPSHITFSTESPYNIQGLAAAQGGIWSGNDKDGWSYTPSQQTVDRYGNEVLSRYFREREPNSKLILKQGLQR